MDREINRRTRSLSLFFWAICAMVGLVACAGPQEQNDTKLNPDNPSDSAERAAAVVDADWETTIEEVVPCVVQLRISVPRFFDTDWAKSTGGTGFVIDKERGYVLTNRHLVLPGPTVADAIFQNQEEVAIAAVYRDPVHDFGIYQFDPSDVTYPELCELELAPEAARVGADIRVIGNDAGEQISILSGTLARLDRRAPRYQRGTYNDFNTFYYQAASGTSGGSSGSPVINVDGEVIALNAGSNRRSAASYYLPLDRVVRAVELLQADQPVTRGTLHSTLEHVPFDELERLGVRPETVDRAREEGATGKGLLVVRDVLPAGAASGLLEPGDVLVTVNGELVDAFVPVEDALDQAVGESVMLGVERGGTPLELNVQVADLHASMPSDFVEISRAIIHPLSYQIARHVNLPVEGLYLATAGYMFGAASVPRNSLLLEIDGEPLKTLDDLWQVLTAHPDGSLLTVRYVDLDDTSRDRVDVVRLDRKWFPMKRCSRDDETGVWPCVDAPPAPAEAPARVAETATRPPLERGGPEAVVAPSLVMIDYDIPYRSEGVWGSYFLGAGVVLDAEEGLVLADRDTVPVVLGDAELTFAGTLRVPATVEFVHPIHNFAILRYDPAALGDTEVEAVRFARNPAKEGDAIWQIGLDSRHQIVSRETTVDRIRPLRLPFPRNRPQFSDSNVEIVTIADKTNSVGGVLTNRRGEVEAFWMSFHMANDDNDSIMRGLPTDVVELVLDDIRNGDPVDYRSLGVELADLPLADARDLGLPAARVDALAARDPGRLQVLSVERTYAGTPAAELLREGDLLVAVNGEPVTRFIEVERASQADEVAVTVLRNGELQELAIATTGLDPLGIHRAAMWAGMLVHEPHLEVASQYGLERKGVYLALGWQGGPGHRYKLYPTTRIVEINGTPTPDMDSFLAAVSNLEDRSSVRIKVLDLKDQPSMLTLKLDLHYWPTWEIVFDDGAWEIRELDGVKAASAESP